MNNILVPNNIHKKVAARVLFFIFIFALLPAHQLYAQKIDLNKILDPTIQNLKKEHPLLRYNIIKIEKFNIDLDNEEVCITLNKITEGIPFREGIVKALYDSIQTALPEPLNTYRLTIKASKYPIEDLVPNYYRSRRRIDKQRNPKELPDVEPIITNKDKPYEITKGLENKHLAIWPSHGWYFDPSLNVWQWQRPYLFGITEDTYTMSYTLPFLIPMLENAGAYVFTPRERDTQTNEVIVDNDTISADNLYVETNGTKYKWSNGDTTGFADKKSYYVDGENPFEMGTYRQCVSRKGGGAMIEWIPEIPEKGDYAVYISYKTLPKSTEDAHYTIFHTGGKTEISVNQTMGGGTWIYLGTFNFNKGNNLNGKVRLTNMSHENGNIVTADAVRFGGGIGNIARTKIISPKSKEVVEPQASGRPRYLEGARYWLQWAGYNDSIYNRNKGKSDYKDDYMCRGEWVNDLIGGSVKAPEKQGKNIPIDMAMGFHTDAGIIKRDTIIGTLGIYMTGSNNGIYMNGQKRLTSRDLTDLIMTEITKDIRLHFRDNWNRRKMTDQSYYEARVPEVPTFLLELLSHQNFEDMKYGLDPNFRFVVSRSIYKGILRYISSQYGTDYVVQPLPVTHFSSEFYNKKRHEVYLSWKEQTDSTETTARADKYVVYTAIDGGGFDNGTITEEEHITLPINEGKIYSFKVTAVNEGGESFPSEVLSVCNMPNNKKTILIVNGFNRTSAPEYFENDEYGGFLDKEDQGVPYLEDISYTGPQYIFNRHSKYKTNTNAGFGACDNNFETTKIAGNTFNFPFVHGQAIKAAGYSFISTSKKALSENMVYTKDYFCMDFILGEEKECTIGKEKKFHIFDEPTRKAISLYLENGGNLFLSGAYIASDIWNRDSICDNDEIAFAEETLKYRLAQTKAGTDGILSNFFCIQKEFQNNYTYYTTLNTDRYAVESPDALEAVNGSSEIFTFSNNLAATIAYKGKYRTLISTIPFETIITDEARTALMKEILNFFSNRW
ncbi:MAG: xanthan lyase [Prevotellaceae bacterium]|nr:xanthan lyase [Prevotellaceae bacterium]